MDDERQEKAQFDLLWEMYLDVRAHSRHAETLRANTVALTVVVGSALVAFITSDKTIDIGDVPACVLIVLTGVGGLA